MESLLVNSINIQSNPQHQNEHIRKLHVESLSIFCGQEPRLAKILFITSHQQEKTMVLSFFILFPIVPKKGIIACLPHIPFHILISRPLCLHLLNYEIELVHFSSKCLTSFSQNFKLNSIRNFTSTTFSHFRYCVNCTISVELHVQLNLHPWAFHISKEYSRHSRPPISSLSYFSLLTSSIKVHFKYSEF